MRALVLATVLLLCSAPLDAGGPPSVRVSTSRGEYSLLVHAPVSGRNSRSPVTETVPDAVSLPLILLVSGEGGWRSFDALLARWLTEAGYWVGGIDAMKYFWKPQDDRQALSADMRAYADALARAAGRHASDPFLLVGFSFGADLAPWIAGAGGTGRIRGLVMIGPDETGSLEARITEILGIQAKDHIFSVAQALKSASGVPVLFVHGEKDRNSAAPKLLGAAGEPKKLVVVPGSEHHFSGHEEDLRKALLEGLAWILSNAGRATTSPVPGKAGP